MTPPMYFAIFFLQIFVFLVSNESLVQNSSLQNNFKKKLIFDQVMAI